MHTGACHCMRPWLLNTHPQVRFWYCSHALPCFAKAFAKALRRRLACAARLAARGEHSSALTARCSSALRHNSLL
jgi:hypothetical protein